MLKKLPLVRLHCHHNHLTLDLGTRLTNNDIHQSTWTAVPRMASRSQQAEGKTYATNDTLTFIIGLSGPSSSGKTTLARLLRPIFNVNEADCRRGRSMKLFILHEDDFYKQDRESV